MSQPGFLVPLDDGSGDTYRPTPISYRNLQAKLGLCAPRGSKLGMFGKAYNALKVICNPKFQPLISPPIPERILSVFSGMKDPWEVFHPQSRHSPKLLLLSPYSKDKIGAPGTI